MQLLVFINDDLHRLAFEEARKIGDSLPLKPGALYAPLDDEEASWIGRIWDQFEEAVSRAYKSGLEAARPVIKTASDLLAQVSEELGRRAEKVRAVLSERLNVYFLNAIDGALRNVRSNLVVGSSPLALQSVTVEQRINMSGTLKASLQEVCAFVAEGSLSISASYNSKIEDA